MIGSKVFDYEIIRKIRAGGMGVVFEGRRTWGRRERVAIKFLLENLRDDPRIRQRFLREAEILETLHHPAIVRILGLDTERDAFIMEYVEGPTLAEYLAHHPRAFHDSAKAVAFFAQILAAFEYAHQMTVEIDGRVEQGVIHRDIKPGNIIIQAGYAPKVLDFGISRIAGFGSTLTDPNLPMGSIAYMSPEQIVDPASIDWRSDIYVLGVNLWELFVGQSPYPKVTNFERAVDVQNHIRREPLVSLLSLVGDVTPDMALFLGQIDRIIARATAKEPADRYQSCAEMSADLQATLRPEVREETVPTKAQMVSGLINVSEEAEVDTVIQHRIPAVPPVDEVATVLQPSPAPLADSVPSVAEEAPQPVPSVRIALLAKPPANPKSGAKSAGVKTRITTKLTDLRLPMALPPLKPQPRRRLIYAAVAVVAGLIIGLFWYQSVTSTRASDTLARQTASRAKASKAAHQKAHADACYQTGQNYYAGNGVPQDYQEAAGWYHKSAESGHAGGQNKLGYMYQLGYGVAQNDTIATLWYRRAAEQGEADGQNSLGFMYEKGLSVKQDYEKAAQWYRKASDQDNANAQNNLGTLHDRGLGVAQDRVKAATLYRRAADQGNKEAQFNLGSLYQFGQGVERNMDKARHWYRVAAKQGDPNARRALRELDNG